MLPPSKNIWNSIYAYMIQLDSTSLQKNHRLQFSNGAMSEGGSSKKVNPWVSLTTGCISGGIECVAVWPMEFIKTQLQLQKVVAGVKPPYTGTVHDTISVKF